MEILKADINDCEEIINVQKAAFLGQAKIYNDYNLPPLLQTVEDFKKEFNNFVILKATEGNRITGSIRAHEKDKTCFISRLIVHPDYQNKGLGAKLLIGMENIFKEKHITTFKLFTGEKSKRNLYLYQKHGYKITKKEQMGNINIVFMEKTQ